jgi:hypothetical protein
MPTSRSITALLSIGAGAMSLALASAVHAAPLLIGTPTGSNAFPFTSDGFETNNRYQQVYAASSFPGPADITAASFSNTVLPGAIFETADYTFTFSTSNFTVNNLDTVDLNNNPGADAALFASLTLSGLTGAKFTIAAGTGGGSAFHYDPSAGDLLVDITRINQDVGSGSGALDSMNGDAGGLFSRAHNFGGGFLNRGLVTEFELQAVPEPSTLALFGIALTALGVTRRRRMV